jgi:hypothetical protein
VVWQNGGLPPSLTSVNDEVDNVHLYTVDGGTTWYGTYALASETIGGPADGTVNDSMLRWDGINWVEETQLRVTSSGEFTVYDSGLTDYAQFSHDGVDFNTTFINTDNWNITGFAASPSNGVNFHNKVWVQGDGTVFWGSAANHGRLSWDAGEAIILSLNSNDLVFDSSGGIIKMRDGANLRIQDGTNADYLRFYHDGSHGNITTDGTAGGNLLLTPAGGAVEMYSGTLLRVRDTGNTDYAEFDHDGTDFNTTFINTTDWNILGAGLRGDIVGTNAVPASDGWSLDGFGYMGSRSNVYITNASVTAGAALLFGVGGAHAVATKLVVADTYSRSQQLFQIRNGSSFEIYDSTNLDKAVFSHDGTDLNTAFTNTAQWNIQGDVNLVDNLLVRPEVQDYGITHQAPTVSANAVTVNCQSGNSATIDLDPATASVVLTLSNPPASGTYGEVNLTIVQGTPAYGITWPGSVVWQNGGLPPSLTSVDNGVDQGQLFGRMEGFLRP